MKILHINTVENAGGAGRAAYRLHQGLLRLGHESSMFVLDKKSDDSTVMAFIASKKLIRRIRRRLLQECLDKTVSRYRKSRPVGYEEFSVERTAFGADMLSQLPTFDLVNLHWISGFLDFKSFFEEVAKKVPIIWTLHDMNPFTGGCHYDNNCGKHTDSCGACPQLGSTSNRDLSRVVWRRKYNIYKQINPENFHIVAPSRWLGIEAQKSTLFKRFSVTTIPYGLDTMIFSPQDKQIVRAALDIPKNARVVLFIAGSLNNRRKGYEFLFKALNDLHNLQNVILVALGVGQSKISSKLAFRHEGFVENDRLLTLFYNAADIFVIPSMQDNLPNTVLESIACGTPVIGFDIGGIPDMVRNGVNGALVPPGDVKALKRAIVRYLKDTSQLNKLAIKCRQIAEEEYPLQLQAERYANVYSRLLDNQIDIR